MTDITNDTAGQDTGNRYEVCQRSNFRAKPGTLVREPITNLLVLPEYVDPFEPQLRVKDKAESLTGSVRPESSDQFIDSISDPTTL